jgi:hypothetical protein
VILAPDWAGAGLELPLLAGREVISINIKKILIGISAVALVGFAPLAAAQEVVPTGTTTTTDSNNTTNTTTTKNIDKSVHDNQVVVVYCSNSAAQSQTVVPGAESVTDPAAVAAEQKLDQSCDAHVTIVNKSEVGQPISVPTVVAY